MSVCQILAAAVQAEFAQAMPLFIKQAQRHPVTHALRADPQ